MPTTATIGVVIHRDLAGQLFSATDRRRLEALGTVRWAAKDGPLSKAEARDLLADADVAVGSWGTPWPDADLLPACPKLRLWIHAAGTVRRWFGPHLAGRDLVIASEKGAIADGVAEFTVAQLSASLRRTWSDAAANRAGLKRSKPDGMRLLCESTIGLVGASAVGMRVARLLRAYRARVLVHDPFLDDRRAADLDVERAPDLLELCRICDGISLHTPLLDSTRGLLGAAHFKAMRDGAVVVNTSRGECLDQDALQAELVRGRLTACLDVTHPEPLPADHPLRALPNCILTSHIAGPATTHIGRCTVDDIAAWLDGGSPADVISAAMLDRIA